MFQKVIPAADSALYSNEHWNVWLGCHAPRGTLKQIIKFFHSVSCIRSRNTLPKVLLTRIKKVVKNSQDDCRWCRSQRGQNGTIRGVFNPRAWYKSGNDIKVVAFWQIFQRHNMDLYKHIYLYNVLPKLHGRNSYMRLRYRQSHRYFCSIVTVVWTFCYRVGNITKCVRTQWTLKRQIDLGRWKFY